MAVLDLGPQLVGEGVNLAYARSGSPVLRRFQPRDLATAGHVVESVRREGKHFVVHFRGVGDAMVFHFGMSGRLSVIPADPSDPSWPPGGPHAQLALALAGAWLVYVDPRKFGSVRWATPEEVAAWALVPDPIRDPKFGEADLRARVQRPAWGRRAVKPLLMDPRFISGVGNIYAAEALHLAGVHPAARARDLSHGQLSDLAHALADVLRAAVLRGGTSVKSYRRAGGSTGSHQYWLRVYGRTSCGSCEHPVSRVAQCGRITHFCPQCQPARDGAAQEAS